MTISEGPGWASTVTEPEPEVFERWRPVARVACSDGVEASLMVAALLSAMGLTSNDKFEPAPVGSAPGPGGQ